MWFQVMIKIFQNINERVYKKAIGILGFVFLISFFLAFARSEGAEGIIFKVGQVTAAMFGFPLGWILEIVHLVQNPFLLIIAIVLDILCYAMLIERIIFCYKRWIFSRKDN